MLKDAPKPKEVLESFLEFCEDLPIMGHNLPFDYAFIKKAMVNEKMTFEKQGLDTLRIARRYLPELESRSLEFLCRHFDIVHTAHRALGDAEATSTLYKKLCEMFFEKSEEEGCKVFTPAPMVYNVKREKAITIAQKEQITRYCALLGISLNRDLDSMTRSEASRFVEKHRLQVKALE
jgi:DNA polymerase-3 subunit alpha (Gram-positive type)